MGVDRWLDDGTQDKQTIFFSKLNFKTIKYNNHLCLLLLNFLNQPIHRLHNLHD